MRTHFYTRITERTVLSARNAFFVTGLLLLFTSIATTSKAAQVGQVSSIVLPLGDAPNFTVKPYRPYSADLTKSTIWFPRVPISFVAWQVRIGVQNISSSAQSFTFRINNGDAGLRFNWYPAIGAEFQLLASESSFSISAGATNIISWGCAPRGTEVSRLYDFELLEDILGPIDLTQQKISINARYDGTGPIPPRLKNVIQSGSSVVLEWDPSLDVGADSFSEGSGVFGYIVLKDGSEVKRLTTSDARFYIDSVDTTKSHSYRYYVVAVDNVGNRSASSNERYLDIIGLGNTTSGGSNPTNGGAGSSPSQALPVGIGPGAIIKLGNGSSTTRQYNLGTNFSATGVSGSESWNATYSPKDAYSFTINNIFATKTPPEERVTSFDFTTPTSGTFNEVPRGGIFTYGGFVVSQTAPDQPPASGSAPPDTGTPVISPDAPVITAFGPVAAKLKAGVTMSLSVTATGKSPLKYQWMLNGTTITGGNDSSYIFSIQAASAGSYSVVVSNSAGSTVSPVSKVELDSTPGSMSYQLSTIAGTALQAGTIDGGPTTARLDRPFRLALDQNGNLYFTQGDYTVRKLSPSGYVTTIAGVPGVSGHVDGPGNLAKFALPRGIATDSSGNVYVADLNTVRKITPQNVVSTIAGSTTGFQDGAGAAAQFESLWDIGLDPANNIYVTEGENLTPALRKISPSGQVTTIATVDQEDYPLRGLRSLWVDSAANVIFCYSHGMARWSASNGIKHLNDLTSGTVSCFAITKAGKLYFTDGRSYLFDASSDPVKVIMGGVPLGAGANSIDGALGTGQFFNPIGLVVDASDNFFVADYYNHAIRKVTLAAGMLILKQGPTSAEVSADESVEFSVVAQDGGGSSPIRYQWLRSGEAIPGATQRTYSNQYVQLRDAGTYSVVISNAAGSITSGAAILKVKTSYALPMASAQSTSNVIATLNGTTTLFAYSDSNPAPTYSWQRKSAQDPVWRTVSNGTVFSGGGTPQLEILNTTASMNGDQFRAQMTNEVGSGFSQVFTLSVQTSRLANLSILTNISPGDPVFTVATVIGGSGSAGSSPLLVRAAGPSLSQLGVGGALSDPKLDVYSGSRLFSTNDNWGGSTALSGVFAQVGAFAYVSTSSNDAAVYSPSLVPGSYSVQISGIGGATGTVIAELYDSTPASSISSAAPRLINVSVLKYIGTGLTAGFVIGGNGNKTVLIRAVGPTLGAAPFNVPGVVSDPQLVLYSGQTIIGGNDNWGGALSLSGVFSQVGAFALPSSSKDAAFVTTLPPGSYTVQASGVAGVSGVALIEVYEVP